MTMEADDNRLQQETNDRLAQMEHCITSLWQDFKQKLNRMLWDLECKTNKRLAYIESIMHKSFTRVGNVCMKLASCCPVPGGGPVECGDKARTIATR